MGAQEKLPLGKWFASMCAKLTPRKLSSWLSLSPANFSKGSAACNSMSITGPSLGGCGSNIWQIIFGSRDRQNQRYLHFNTHRLWVSYATWRGETRLQMGLRLLVTWSWEGEIYWIIWRVQCDQKGPCKWGKRVGGSEWGSMRNTQTSGVGWEHRRGHEPTDTGSLWKLGKARRRLSQEALGDTALLTAGF